jgi:hypothetical protein
MAASVTDLPIVHHGRVLMAEVGVFREHRHEAHGVLVLYTHTRKKLVFFFGFACVVSPGVQGISTRM